MPSIDYQMQIELSREGNADYEEKERAKVNKQKEKDWMSALSKAVFFKDIT